MKAIDTYHNGRYFCSRLEARWAIFFESMNIPYQYEREGYVLFPTLCYLPDFWLPTLDVHVEIKCDETRDELDDFKCGTLALQSGKDVLMIVGDPTNYKIVTFDKTWDSDTYIDDGHLGRCPKCDQLYVCGSSSASSIGPLTSCPCERWPTEHPLPILNALSNASTARFEFNGRHA